MEWSFKYNKIVIVGPTCSGKTTLARALSLKYDIPIIHIDSIRWNSNWQQNSEENISKKVLKQLNCKKWIVEGHVDIELLKSIFEKADKIIIIERNWGQIGFNYLKRLLKYSNKSRPEMANGCNEYKFTDFKKNMRRFMNFKYGILWHRNNSFKLAKKSFSCKLIYF